MRRSLLWAAGALVAVAAILVGRSAFQRAATSSAATGSTRPAPASQSGIPAHSALGGAAIAFDPATSTVVAFGGAPDVDLGNGNPVAGNPTADTYVWNGSTWRRLHPATSPPPRSQGLLVYDSAIRQLILYGGRDTPPPHVTPAPPCPGRGCPAGSGVVYPTRFLGDTWSWDGTTWTPRRNSGISAVGAAMFYDPISHRLLLFGFSPLPRPGMSVGGPERAWAWNGRRWIPQTAGGNPPGPAMAFDPVSARLLAFTGMAGCSANGPATDTPYAASPDCPNPAATTWAWNGRLWEHLHPPTNPSQAGAVIATAPDGRGVAVFNALGQTWLWDGSGWSRLHPKRSPPPSPVATLRFVDDPASHLDLLVLSGLSGNDQSWTWNGRAWTPVGGTP